MIDDKFEPEDCDGCLCLHSDLDSDSDSDSEIDDSECDCICPSKSFIGNVKKVKKTIKELKFKVRTMIILQANFKDGLMLNVT